MSDQIPLYVGIPLAGLCIAGIIFMIAFAISVLRDRKQ